MKFLNHSPNVEARFGGLGVVLYSTVGRYSVVAIEVAPGYMKDGDWVKATLNSRLTADW